MKHKSSKHISRDHSDYYKDSGAKGRRRKDEISAKTVKDSSFVEKRRLDSTDVHGNGEYSEEYVSSKRSKEGRGGYRWNGGEEGSKKSKAIRDSKNSERRVESVGVHCEGDEVKRSSGKHRILRPLVARRTWRKRRNRKILGSSKKVESRNLSMAKSSAHPSKCLKILVW